MVKWHMNIKKTAIVMVIGKRNIPINMTVNIKNSSIFTINGVFYYK